MKIDFECKLCKVLRHMNFKERGITVGDLFLLVIIIISFFIVLKVKESRNDQSALLHSIFIDRIIESEYEKNL